jgi:predicted HTH domain antitoxin
MSIMLEVPESLTWSLRLPESEAEERLQCELALSLYAQGILSCGRATELAAISRSFVSAVLSA